MTATTADIAIPTDFGSGGKGLAPNGAQGTPDLQSILAEHRTALNNHAGILDDSSDALTARKSRLVEWVRGADAAANTATAERVLHRADRAKTITAIRFVPDAALTADATNNATLTIKRRDPDGTNPVTVATLVTDVAGGSWSQWVAKSLGAVANAALVVGSLVTLTITKDGTGVVVPGGALGIDTTDSAL